MSAPVKCWQVETTDDGDAGVVYVCAAMRNQARVAALDIDPRGVFHEAGYVNLRATRFAAYDGGFTARQLIADGCWIECAGCGQRVDRECEGEWPRSNFTTLDLVYERADVWCCPECRAHAFRDNPQGAPELRPETRQTSIFIGEEW